MAKKKASDYPVNKKKLDADISGGNFRPCYLIYGEEEYLCRFHKNRLKHVLAGQGENMNVHYAEGSDIDAEALVSFAETMPFFADRRAVFVENSGFFKSGCEALERFLADPPDTATFVFAEKEVDGRNRLFRLVQETGLVLACDRQRPEYLEKWITAGVQREGKVITREAVQMLLGRAGTDMSILSNEYKKLVDYTGDRKEIGTADVKEICAGWLSDHIFEMTDAIAAGNTAAAISLYKDLLALKVEPLKIQSLILRQFYIMLQVQEMSKNRASRQMMAEVTGVSVYHMGKYEGWADRFSPERLKKIIDFCLSNDKAAKTGKLDMTVSVEMLIMQCK